MPEPFTSEDVDLVANALWRPPTKSPTPTIFEHARRALVALTEAGWRRPGDPAAQLIDERDELRHLFDMQQRRMAEATERWRAEDPDNRANILPDLGRLLQWLMDKADEAATRQHMGEWQRGETTHTAEFADE